jgi:hypothetical protein
MSEGRNDSKRSASVLYALDAGVVSSLPAGMPQESEGVVESPQPPGVWERWQGLSPARRVLLVLLNGVGLLLLVLALTYAIVPDAAPAADTANSPLSTISATPFSGIFALASVPDTQTLLSVEQIGPNLTGTLTTISCPDGHALMTQRLVTGQMLPNGLLRLTYTQPGNTNSAIGIYAVLAQTDGFNLAWNDATGQAQQQTWVRVEAQIPPPCPS